MNDQNDDPASPIKEASRQQSEKLDSNTSTPESLSKDCGASVPLFSAEEYIGYVRTGIKSEALVQQGSREHAKLDREQVQNILGIVWRDRDVNDCNPLADMVPGCKRFPGDTQQYAKILSQGYG